MGIDNIHILIQPDANINPQLNQVRALQEHMVEAHHRGEHPDGSKRRECPLCQLGK